MFILGLLVGAALGGGIMWLLMQRKIVRGKL